MKFARILFLATAGTAVLLRAVDQPSGSAPRRELPTVRLTSPLPRRARMASPTSPASGASCAHGPFLRPKVRTPACSTGWRLANRSRCNPGPKPCSSSVFASFGAGRPSERCLPHGIPDAMIVGNFKIVQDPGLFLILYEEFARFRQIFTDGRDLPRGHESRLVRLLDRALGTETYAGG